MVSVEATALVRSEPGVLISLLPAPDTSLVAAATAATHAELRNLSLSNSQCLLSTAKDAEEATVQEDVPKWLIDQLKPKNKFYGNVKLVVSDQLLSVIHHVFFSKHHFSIYSTLDL